MDAVGHLGAALSGRYAIDREIGRGGMATVYLARDVRHNRKVALKVLDPELGAVLGTERFLAEIQVTANLQHPNLLPLFDSGEANGLLFYVMPYVEGENLRAKLNREKQLPVDEAIRITVAVASALDYAHRHNVIHRDLKPENILIHDGQPVVADFGIALAVSNAGGNRITQTGLSLGTPQYMSPEQATGDREIDGRTDLYSLGAVAYEMLVGEPPHDGKTSQAIIAKILTDRPRSVRLARETVPAHVDDAVIRALAKLPADRFHTARDFAEALLGRAAATSTPLVNAAEPAPRARDRRSIVKAALPWAVATAATVTAVAGWSAGSRPSGDEAVLRYEISLPPNTDVTGSQQNTVAISDGGRYVAYIASRSDGSRRILVRAADEIQSRELPGSEGATFVMFSPDASEIAFLANDQLLRTPVQGGRVQVIADGFGTIVGATWSSSGWIVTSGLRGLFKIPAVGGTPQLMTVTDTARNETGHIFPLALADGRTVLFVSRSMGGPANWRIGVASIEGGTSKILDLAGSWPLGVLDGNLVYTTAAGTLMVVPFDVSAQRLTGPSLPLTDQAAVNTAFGVTFAHMAADGALVYVAGALRRQLVLTRPDGTAQPLAEPDHFSWPRISPDGKLVAVSMGSLSRRDVWVGPYPTGPLSRLTAGGSINDRPEWTPDSRVVIFRSNRGPRNAIWVQPVEGGEARLLFGRDDSHIDEGVMSPDGAHLLVQRDSTGSGQLWVKGLRGDTTIRRVTPFAGYGGRFSPDGKWIVYTSTEGGPEQVYVRSFPSLTNQVQVSLTGGGSPVWSPDGKRIFFVNGSQLMAATIGSTQPFTIASRSVVLSRGYSFLGVHADYDVAPDGTVLTLQAPSSSAQLVVVRNLAAELRRRVQGAPR